MTKIYIAKIPLVLKNDKGEDYRVGEGEAVTLTDDEYVQLSEYVTVCEAADPETAQAIAEAVADAPAETPADTAADSVAADAIPDGDGDGEAPAKKSGKRGQKPDA